MGANTDTPPICPHNDCGQPMTPYVHDPLRWWVCTRHWTVMQRTAEPPRREEQ